MSQQSVGSRCISGKVLVSMHSHLQLLGLWQVLEAGSGTEAKIKPVIGKICQ